MRWNCMEAQRLEASSQTAGLALALPWLEWINDSGACSPDRICFTTLVIKLQ